MRTVLTNMCMVYDDNHNILVEDRVLPTWPGITFPGGHVEDDETIEHSVIREVKEETGLDITDIECCGHIEWLGIEENARHLAILYRTKKYSGELQSSREGRVFWINIADIDKYTLSTDFDKILSILIRK